MCSLGAIGRPSLKEGIGIGCARVAIPANIGELDYVGYFAAEQLLVVLEDKMVDCGFEPTYLRDDISSFVDGRKSYAEQIRRKVNWAKENMPAISQGLSSLLPGRPAISPTRLAGALVTLYPTYASYFITDYPCRSLSELMTEFSEEGRWPYDGGVINVA